MMPSNSNIHPLYIAFFLFLTMAYILSCTSLNDSSVPKADMPEGMVYIPAGEFVMGGKSGQAEEDELPRHKVKVDGFFMDKTEVTNRDFLEFAKATQYRTVAERDIDWEEMKSQLPPGTPKPPDSILQPGSLVFSPTSGPVSLEDYSQWWEWTIGADWRHPDGPDSDIKDRMDHPVVHIAWEDALAFTEWAGKRLPTEAEWEWASMGGKDDVKYPWGNEDIERSYDKANFWQGMFPFQNEMKDGYFGTAPIQSYPPNGYGLYDMAGNVWEWCFDKYNAYSYQEDKEKGTVVNPQGPKEFFDPAEPYTPKYVLRGGSFLCNDSYCSGYRVARRMRSSKDSGFNHTGFRCVRDLQAGWR